MQPLKILCLGAHPDDIEFGAGAILAKQASLGSIIKWVIVSKGEASTNGTPEQRIKETQKAAELISSEIEFLNFGGDSHITYKTEYAFHIAQIIRQFQADTLLVPMPSPNQHPDHATLGNLARDASRFARYGGIQELSKFSPHHIRSLFYFPSTPNLSKRPDILIDISENLNIWKNMMAFHESQHATRNYSSILLAMSQVWGMQIGTDHAWGLFKNDPLVLNSLSDINKNTPNF